MRTPNSRVLAALFVVAALSAPPATLGAQDPTSIESVYRGEMVDPDGVPLSGTFPLTFTLFDSPDGQTPLWTETRFVTVFNGGYELHLGRATPMAPTLAGQSLTIAITLGSLGEITRAPYTPVAWAPPVDPLDTANVERITFADLAGRAIRADRAQFARDCRTLGGRDVTQIDRSADMMGRIEDVRDELREGAGAQVGEDRQYVDRFGGPNGNRYEHNCPPGYVITGARGGAGNVVDGIQFVCSQIQ
jgi:hypothetical protein